LRIRRLPSVRRGPKLMMISNSPRGKTHSAGLSCCCRIQHEWDCPVREKLNGLKVLAQARSSLS